MPVLTEKIAEVNWEFAEEDTQYLTHNNHRYSGKFIPQIAKKVIELLTSENDVICDSYMGSGTTLLEAQLLKRHSVGIDLNPLAVLISKCKNLHFSDDAYNCLNNTLIPNLDVLIYPDQLPMFSGLTGRTHAEDWRLQDAWHKKWFQPDVLEKLVIIYEQIQLLQCPEAQLIATVSFSDVLRKFSNASTKYPNVMFDKNAPKKSLPYKSFLETLRRNIEGLIKLKTKQIPERFQPNIIEGTNLSIPLNDDSIDAIITHPPYIAAIPYAEYGSLSLGWLGYDVKGIDKKLTGSKRQSKDVVERFLANYSAFFIESFRILKKSKYMFIMVGNPTAHGKIVDLEKNSIELASEAGFTHIYTATRKGINRRGNKMGQEYLIFFQK